MERGVDVGMGVGGRAYDADGWDAIFALSGLAKDLVGFVSFEFRRHNWSGRLIGDESMGQGGETQEGE